MAVLIIIMSYRIKVRKTNILWPITFLKIYLPFFSGLFYGQIFLLLTTIFDCQNGSSYVSKDLSCKSGEWFSIESPLAIIAIIFHVIIAFMNNTLNYKSIYTKNGSDVLKKTNYYSDISLLLTKIGVITLFSLDDCDEDNHWAILFFLILFTGSNMICVFLYQSRQNKNLDFVTIFIAPPSEKELQQRLVNRKTENKTQIKNRLQKTKKELSYADKYDYIVYNIDLETTVKQVEAIYLAEQRKREK